MRIAFVAMGDPQDRRIWSGTPHYAFREISKRVPELRVIDTKSADGIINSVNKATRRIGWDIAREPATTRLYGRVLQQELEKFDPDAVLSIGASNKLCDTAPRWPIVHVSDALFATITTYYSRYRGLTKRSRALGNAIQQRLIDRSSSILLTSEWAKQSAEELYQVAPGLIRVVPIGANLDRDPTSEIATVAKERLRLLFVGIDWERKGGPLMLDVFARIRAAEPDAELHIVGCTPAAAHDKPGVIMHGFLRKADPEQRAQLERLYREASLFTMLSLEEAFGLVYCEAAAYGLPSIALHTGGVPTIVRNDVSGLLFDPLTKAEDMARAITGLWKDRPRYDRMRVAARREYEMRLNWTAWGDSVEEELRRAADKKRGRVSSSAEGRACD